MIEADGRFYSLKGQEEKEGLGPKAQCEDEEFVPAGTTQELGEKWTVSRLRLHLPLADSNGYPTGGTVGVSVLRSVLLHDLWVHQKMHDNFGFCVLSPDALRRQKPYLF